MLLEIAQTPFSALASRKVKKRRLMRVKYWWREAEAFHNSAPNHLEQIRPKPPSTKITNWASYGKRVLDKAHCQEYLRLSDGTTIGGLRLSTRRVEARSASFNLNFHVALSYLPFVYSQYRDI